MSLDGDGDFEALGWPWGPVRQGRRPGQMVERFRMVRSEPPPLASLLPARPETEAFLAEGGAIADRLDALENDVETRDAARRRAVREASAIRKELVTAFRRLDKKANEAGELAPAVPGRSRDVLEHWMATRSRDDGEEEDEDDEEVEDGESDVASGEADVASGEADVASGEADVASGEPWVASG